MELPDIILPELYPKVELTDYRKAGLVQLRLLKPFSCAINLYDITVPQGYEFEISVPWGFRNTFDPENPSYRAAGCVHDLLYETEYFPQSDCDAVFLAILCTFGDNSWFERNVMWLAVRLGGRAVWRKHTDAQIRLARQIIGITDTRRPLKAL